MSNDGEIVGAMFVGLAIGMGLVFLLWGLGTPEPVYAGYGRHFKCNKTVLVKAENDGADVVKAKLCTVVDNG